MKRLAVYSAVPLPPAVCAAAPAMQPGLEGVARKSNARPLGDGR